MSTSAQVIIEAGYARSTTNDPGKLAVDGELLGRLNRMYQSLWALAARQRPESFTSTTSLVLGGAPPSATLPTDIVELQYIRNALSAKVHLIPVRELDRTWHITPSVYQQGLSLISRGQVGDPVAGDVLSVWLIAAATTLAALATNLDALFPVRHHEILVNDIALYLDAKDEGRDANAFARLVNDQKMKLAAFAAEYNLNVSALEFVHGASERAGPPAGAAQ